MGNRWRSVNCHPRRGQVRSGRRGGRDGGDGRGRGLRARAPPRARPGSRGGGDDPGQPEDRACGARRWWAPSGASATRSRWEWSGGAILVLRLQVPPAVSHALEVGGGGDADRAGRARPAARPALESCMPIPISTTGRRTSTSTRTAREETQVHLIRTRSRAGLRPFLVGTRPRPGRQRGPRPPRPRRGPHRRRRPRLPRHLRRRVDHGHAPPERAARACPSPTSRPATPRCTAASRSPRARSASPSACTCSGQHAAGAAATAGSS